MEDAFSSRYDPALELATHRERAEGEGERPDLELVTGGPWTEDLRRKEQDEIDLIVKGGKTGHYYVLLGAKVTCCASCCPRWVL